MSSEIATIERPEATFCVYFTNSKREDRMPLRCFHLALLVTCLGAASLQAQSRKAPPGMFKDLDDLVAGDAIIVHGKQLFVDDSLIAESQGVTKVLNQPVKHPNNPLLVKDRPWEESGPGYG